MKKNDIKVITNLRVNGRIPLTELSRKTGLPVSTIHEQLKKKIEQGMMRPSMLLRFEKIGFDTRAYILLGVDPSEKEKLLAYLAKHQNVNSLFRINSGWTAIMECVFKDMYALESFIETIDGMFTVKQKQVCYVLDELRREAFFSDEILAEGLALGKQEAKLKYTEVSKSKKESH